MTFIQCALDHYRGHASPFFDIFEDYWQGRFFSRDVIATSSASVKLLDMIEDRSIKKVVGRLPDLNLDLKAKFSFMAVTNVLHHVVGKTTEESRNIVKESLVALREHLDDSGFLMIQEVLWETYMIPTATRTVAFFSLSLQQVGSCRPMVFHPR